MTQLRIPGALLALALPLVGASGRVHAEPPVVIDDDDEPITIEGDDEAPAASGAELDEGELLILDDEGAAPATGDESIVAEGDEHEDLLIVEDEDQILIIDQGKPEPTEVPRITGALGRLWEALHIAVDGNLQLQAQLVSLDDGPFRTQVGAFFDTWLIPAQNISFYANGFARLTLDVPTQTVLNLVPVVDLYEAYAKINAEVGSVVLGRIVVPWGRTSVAGLGDRLNPPDHRRAPGAFPDPVKLRQPQWGAQVRTSLSTIALEGVVLTLYEPTEGSLTAANQGGVRAARYQTALLRAPNRIGGAFASDDRAGFIKNENILDATTVGIRARQRLYGFDIGATGVWGIDEVPRLDLSRPAARFLAIDAYRAQGMALPRNPCGVDESEELCFGEFLSHGRTASVSADVAYGLQNIVILKAEVLAHPNLAFLPGKTAHVVDERGLRSVQVGMYAGALAVEGGYGDWVTGSLEYFHIVWNGVPDGATLWGVQTFGGLESLLYPFLPGGQVHRPALGWSFYGYLFDQALDWKVRGELGLLQLDTLFTAEVRYRIPVLNVYIGGRSNVFAGWPGSPGWMRQDATQLGVFAGWPGTPG